MTATCSDADARLMVDLARNDARAVARGRDDLADELESAAMVGLARGLRSFRPERGGVVSWARRKARGEMLTFVRGEMRRARRIPQEPLRDAPAEHRWPDLDLAGALAALPAADRAAVDLRFGGGLALRDVGRRLGVTEARACQVIGRALARMREGRIVASCPERRAERGR